MTDSEKNLIKRVKKDIENMDFLVEIIPGRHIQIRSEHLMAIWQLESFENVITFEVLNMDVYNSMTAEEWEDFVVEIDNLNRAISWINTQVKGIVLVV